MRNVRPVLLICAEDSHSSVDSNYVMNYHLLSGRQNSPAVVNQKESQLPDWVCGLVLCDFQQSFFEN
jgi:hypothetical protein